MNLKNRLPLLICYIFLAITSVAQAIKFPQSESSTIGIAVYDIRTGKLVYEENYGKSMIPASTLKAVTSAAALETLGSDFRFQTQIYITGHTSDGILDGNLIIKAIGDPTTGSSHFQNSTDIISSIISQLRERGITTIRGTIIVDESQFADPGFNPQWTIGDAGESYAPGLYGMNYADNIFKYKTASGISVPQQPEINAKLRPSESSLSVIHGINSNNYIIEGRNLSAPGTIVTLIQNNPGETFTIALAEQLRIKGIVVENSTDASTAMEECILKFSSPSLKDILASMMRRSDNMMAEGVLRAISQGSSRAAAIKAEYGVMNRLGVNSTGVRIVDGSGLARLDRVTPRFMTQLLVKMATGSNSKTYLSFFPKVGKEGTVASFLSKTPLKGLLALKSGSINGVHCYAGYKITADGQPTHAVVIMINNFFCSRQAVRSAIELFLTNFDWK